MGLLSYGCSERNVVVGRDVPRLSARSRCSGLERMNELVAAPGHNPPSGDIPELFQDLEHSIRDHVLVRRVLEFLNGLDVNAVTETPELLELPRELVIEDLSRVGGADQEVHLRVPVESALDDLTLHARDDTQTLRCLDPGQRQLVELARGSR